MIGKVYIVGIGPGAIDLLTIRALHAIKKAHIILYDALINQQIIDIYCRDKMRIFVGKRLGEDSATVKQDKIHQMMIGFAKSGKIVARLKNGDPLIFGRGAEEAEVLKKYDIPYEYIPGVTAVSGAASYTSIPLTHRKMSSSILIATGNFAQHNEYKNSKFFKQLAEFDGTIAIYMGSERLSEISSNLISMGRKGTTPIAIISNATTPMQKITTTTLSQAAKKEMEIKRPAILLIGDVVSLQPSLDWAKTRKLINKLFILTRPIENVITLNSALIDEGATTFLFPSIQYKNIDVSVTFLKNLSKFSWIVFKSQYSVKRFFDILNENNIDFRKLHSVKIAAIGEVTASKLQQFGIIADLVPQYFSTDVLTKVLINKLSRNDRILICTANIRNKQLEDELKAKGIKYKLMTLYEIVQLPENMQFQKWKELQELLKGFNDINVIFASGQTVRNFFKSMKTFVPDLDVTKWEFYSIGKETTAVLTQFGKLNIVEASLPTESSLLEKILK